MNRITGSQENCGIDYYYFGGENKKRGRKQILVKISKVLDSRSLPL
jgi:hypothetical protein